MYVSIVISKNNGSTAEVRYLRLVLNYQPNRWVMLSPLADGVHQIFAKLPGTGNIDPLGHARMIELHR